MRKLIFLSILSFVTYRSVGQGCVAIRSTGAICTMTGHQAHDTTTHWLFNTNNRYFKSFRHFVGTDEQKQRVDNGTEVINHSYALNLTLYRIINSKWSVMFDVPVIANSRSSLYEHKNVGRYLTHSFGVGDIRLAVYRWIIDPLKMPKGNVQAGLGIKLPTGDYKFQDYFHLTDSTRILGPVDQSIQLGDGGTGFTGELNGFYNFSTRFNVYGNIYYLLNPREQNGVSTGRGAAPSASAVKNGSDVMSVPDQYMIRVGANYVVNNFNFSAGVRRECIPVHDLVGGSNGFRRPGYVFSAEPGVSYTVKKTSIYAYVPVALVRNRTQSVPDIISSGLTGQNVHGDAAFADYSVNIGLSVRF